MKNNTLLLLIFSFFLCFSCKQKEANYAILTGEIENYKKPSLLVSRKFSINDVNNLKKELKIIDNKTFADTIYMDNAGMYQLTDYGYNIYLKPGDSIHLKINATNFRAPFTFIGGNTVINEYMWAKYEKQKELLPSFNNYIKLEKNTIITLFSKIKIAFNNLLEPLKTNHPKFYALEKRNFDYFFTYMQSEYNKYKENPSSKLSELHNDIIKDIDYDNAADFEFSSNYKRLTQNKFLTNLDNANDINTMFSNIKALKSKNIKNYLYSNMGNYLNPDQEHLDLFYSGITETLKDTTVLKEINTAYKKAKRFSKGQPGFPFNYENYEGGTTSTEDLKGKYVYVDMWATWCSPCKREIPYLEKIEKKYHDANIEFVSISIDAKKDSWKKFVKDKNLGGIQLLAKNDWKSSIVKNYDINGIPRFMLFDTQGNIITVNAPRPSEILDSDYLDKILANKS